MKLKSRFVMSWCIVAVMLLCPVTVSASSGIDWDKVGDVGKSGIDKLKDVGSSVVDTVRENGPGVIESTKEGLKNAQESISEYRQNSEDEFWQRIEEQLGTDALGDVDENILQDAEVAEAETEVSSENATAAAETAVDTETTEAETSSAVATETAVLPDTEAINDESTTPEPTEEAGEDKLNYVGLGVGGIILVILIYYAGVSQGRYQEATRHHHRH